MYVNRVRVFKPVINSATITDLDYLSCVDAASAQAIRRARRHWTVLAGTSQHDDAYQGTSATVRHHPLVVVVVVNGSYSAAPYSSPDRECITKSQLIKIKDRRSTHRKKVSFEFALERANSVCVTICCRNTVPYDWPVHREGSVAKFRSCTWNWIIDAGRWAETNPSRIATARLYRTAEMGTVECGSW